MPISVTLTKTHNINAVAERNGFTRQKSIEIVEIWLELIKQSHNGSARLEALLLRSLFARVV
jgi:hypothetical protein